MRPALPRLIVYHQTHHSPGTKAPVSLLPLLHSLPAHLHRHLVIIVAAIHLNNRPSPHLTLNDDAPSHAKFDDLKSEISALKSAGITVMGMLGGAAKGSYAALDSSEFETYYALLVAFILEYGIEGLDLDVEEPMSEPGILRLILRLKEDFGPNFIISLAPVAPAMYGGRHLSGFDYRILENRAGEHVDWYNVQFYCGWGEVAHVRHIVRCGWKGEKIVVGVPTNPANAAGYVGADAIADISVVGGVMGWEYFNALPGGEEDPWLWVLEMAGILGLLEDA